MERIRAPGCDQSRKWTPHTGQVLTREGRVVRAYTRPISTASHLDKRSPGVKAHYFRVARYPTRMAMSTRTEAVDKFRAYNLQTITNAEENL